MTLPCASCGQPNPPGTETCECGQDPRASTVPCGCGSECEECFEGERPADRSAVRFAAWVTLVNEAAGEGAAVEALREEFR